MISSTPLRQLATRLRRVIPLGLLFAGGTLSAQTADRPNILWITSEDNGPQLGCYGDSYAVSPNIDRLAAKGLRFTHVWSNAPVCAPARTTIISGRYPTGDGAEHMRSSVPLPTGCQMYPQLLRQAGYYCTNNNKEDYNLQKPEGTWDMSNGKAHYKNRAPGQPFFAVFNIQTSHESQIRKPDHPLVHDPAKAPIPPYHPDTPEVRHDWAQYYDKITEMDQEVGQRLDELEKAGLADDTIVFYYGDHGAGMPRSKRWPYNTGLRVPLIVHFPAKYAHLAPAGYSAGAASDRLVSFVDLAPTLLSIIGSPVPDFFQGAAFAGKTPAPAPTHLYGFRGRMDERYDMIRSVTDGRHVYIRNYFPQLPYAQYVAYMFAMPTAQVWERMAREGTLNADQRHFWEPKPVEELYDLQSDPYEVKNLAGTPAYASVLDSLRSAEMQQARKVRDLGFIPEAERLRIAAGKSPRDAFASDAAYPFEQVLQLARQAGNLSSDATPALVAALSDANAIVRYWGVTGLYVRKEEGVRLGEAKLTALLKDTIPSVRIAAARALAEFGPADSLGTCLDVLIADADPTKTSQATAMEALNAIDVLDKKALPLKARIAALPKVEPGIEKRIQEYVSRLLEKILRDLE
ncbi:MAG: sulfatase-like hydrolase/transferase [Verrucomicrobium sp.]|nr:sulfatase-like hydrolase/transferase [Verrucomicrobium sp.]